MHPRRSIACFRNDLEGEEVTFAEPREIVVAREAEDFLPALDRVEEARRSGKWLAGYLSYEAGYLLDPALVSSLPSGRRAPLLCFGVFDGPADASVPDKPTNAAIYDAR